MMSDVIHHFYAQRTGGDTLRRLGQADRQQARAALRDEFGRWGNVPENLRSLFRAGHLNNDVLKGIEAEALAEIGVTRPSELSLPKAHITKGRTVTGDIVGATTAQEAIEGMRPQFQIQGRETQAAIEATQPLMEELDVIAGSTYSPMMSAEELAVRRNVLEANPQQVKAAIQRQFSPFIIRNGAVRLAGFVPLGAAATAAFTVSDIAQAAQGVSSVQQATSTPEAVAGGLEAVSGALGVAATKFPVLAVPAVVFSTVGGAMRLRMQRDIERERTQQVMAGEVSRYGPAVTETPTLTKPESDYKRRRRARTGR